MSGNNHAKFIPDTGCMPGEWGSLVSFGPIVNRANCADSQSARRLTTCPTPVTRWHGNSLTDPKGSRKNNFTFGCWPIWRTHSCMRHGLVCEVIFAPLLILLCHKSSARTTTQRAAGKLLHKESGDLNTQCCDRMRSEERRV